MVDQNIDRGRTAVAESLVDEAEEQPIQRSTALSTVSR